MFRSVCGWFLKSHFESTFPPNSGLMKKRQSPFLKKRKKKFSASDIAAMKKTAAIRYADRNPYSWNMEYYEYEDGSGYEARFSKCGICALTKKLGLFDLTPALCRLDYTMSEAGGASDFVHEYTLASGGEYCDCGYKKHTMQPCAF